MSSERGWVEGNEIDEEEQWMPSFNVFARLSGREDTKGREGMKERGEEAGSSVPPAQTGKGSKELQRKGKASYWSLGLIVELHFLFRAAREKNYPIVGIYLERAFRIHQQFKETIFPKIKIKMVSFSSLTPLSVLLSALWSLMLEELGRIVKPDWS
jgi:hypothetical protein